MEASGTLRPTVEQIVRRRRRFDVHRALLTSGAMADQIVPQGSAGSPIRRNEPRPAGSPGETGRIDGVPEFIEPGVTGDRQSRRYAHTLRRDGVSGPIRTDTASAPVRTGDPASASVHASEAISAPVRASEVMNAPVRVSDVASAPVRAAEAASPTTDHLDRVTNRASAPADSTALYRKRTNPALPTVSPDMVAGAQPITDTPEVDAAVDAAIEAAIGHAPTPRPDDLPSDLPSVMLDAPASPGLGMRPLALRRPPMQLILSIIAAALVVIGLWMMRLAF
jgi:hypothetical protein